LSGGYPADARLGVDGPASTSGRRLLCLAAAGHSFQGAADALAEFCGLKVCDNTVRSVALAAGRAAREWRRTSPAAQADRGAVAGAARRGDDGIVLPALLGPVGRLLVGRRVSAGIGYRTPTDDTGGMSVAASVAVR
jgi:hypothetical protein